MAKYVLDLNSNDELNAVIRKCNANFRALAVQLDQQSRSDSAAREEMGGDIAEQIAEAIGEAVDDLVGNISRETEARQQADQALQNAIEVVDGKFSDYTPSESLAAIATTGDYADLLNTPAIPTVPQIPVDGAYATFGAEDPSSIHGGTWVLAGTLAVGMETLNVWKRTA